MSKKIKITCYALLVGTPLFPASQMFAKTIQDMPVGETTISSKSEELLQEYKEKDQNQLPTVESTVSQEAPEMTSGSETSTESAADSTDSSIPSISSVEEQFEGKNERIEPSENGTVPLARRILVEGLPGSSTPYDIDKNFANTLRLIYRNAPNPMTAEFMESLRELDVSRSNLTSLKGIEFAVNLTFLYCSNNQLSTLDVSSNTALTYLDCSSNQLSSLDVSNNALNYLNCNFNQLSSLGVSNNTTLVNLFCSNNQLSSINVSNNTSLGRLDCSSNQLRTLDVSSSTALTYLNCNNNQLRTLDVSNNTVLKDLNCYNNQLSSLDVSNSNALTTLYCSYNQLSDITSFYGLTRLTTLDASNQSIAIPIPQISEEGKAVVDLLKTTAQTGLSASNGTVAPPPAFSYEGDKVVLSNVTREALDEKSIHFNYNGRQLAEGSGYYNWKYFSGTIKFYTTTNVKSELKPIDKQKVQQNEEVDWQWKFTSLTAMKVENIQAQLNLPVGLVIVPGSVQVEKNGAAAPPISDLEVTNNLGDLNQGDTVTITFKTTATGRAEEWLEAIGVLEWEDEIITSPYSTQAKGAVQILDDEQQYKPEAAKNLAIESVPRRFNYGIKNIESSAKTYTLDSNDYQTHTNVVTKGFYTRIKDERAEGTGWKLTASLSNFTDLTGEVMPNSVGASLAFGNLSIENITNQDTPQETINPTPTGTPSTVPSSETLVAGQAAKTLIAAQPGEGQDTWQLRMPFNDLSLNLSANAGERNTVYQATLTWSLDDTP